MASTVTRPASGALRGPDRVGRRLPAWPPAAMSYLAGSLALHHRMLAAPGTATGDVPSDSGLFTWWLAWTWSALRHGHDPLFTTAMNAPDGVNALWNTAVPVLGVLLAPITATAGPRAAYDVGMVLGPVVSGLAAYLALRPWCRRAWVRTVGGAMVGFGPFALAHAGVGHLNLVWTVLPPALLWAVHALVWPARRTGPWRVGALLGLAFAVQTGIYTQTVALGVVAGLVVVVVLVARFPHEARRRYPDLLRAALAAAAVYAVLCAYPLWLLLAGPGRPRAPVRDVASTGADAANLVVPTAVTAWRPLPGADRLHAYVGEQGSYLGILVLLVLVVGAVVVRRTAVRLAVVVAGLLAVLSLGTSLTVLGRDLGVPLPWRLLLDVPLLSQAEPGRLAPFVTLAAVLALVLILDHVADRHVAVAVALALAAAVTWWPADAQQTTRTAVPAFFEHGAAALRAGETVTTWPRASGRWADGADPMVWQAASAMAFRLTGGYFIGADADHDLLLEGPVTEYERGASGQPADPRRARAELAARGVGAVLVVPRADVDLPAALRWTRLVTGADGRFDGGVWVFGPS